MISLRVAVFVPLLAVVCLGQVTAPLLDQVRNWPAPLYWQPPAATAEGIHEGGRHMEDVRPKAGVTPPTPAIFVAVTPCRVADTRSTQGFTGVWGPPALAGYAARNFDIPTNPYCPIPSTAVAYSLNFTVVPPGPVDVLSAWQEGQPYPTVSP